MLIKVTKKHINNGIRCEEWACPVAIAIREQGEFWHVSVGSEEIILNDLTYNAPLAVRTFVENFDQSLPVAPFEFVIAD